jgi:hypothetical protein
MISIIIIIFIIVIIIIIVVVVFNIFIIIFTYCTIVQKSTAIMHYYSLFHMDR